MIERIVSSKVAKHPDAEMIHPWPHWLDVHGQPISDSHLKMLSKTWSAQTWEAYLTWYQMPRAESLVSPRRYDQLREQTTESLFGIAQSNADDALKDRISVYLDGLTEQQRQVIEMVFWQGRSERYVAHELGIRQQSVHRLKNRSLKKIRDLLREGVVSRIKRGEISPFSSDMGEANGNEVLDLAFGNLPQAG